MTHWLTHSLTHSETDIFSIYLPPANHPNPTRLISPKSQIGPTQKNKYHSKLFPRPHCNVWMLQLRILIYPSHAFNPHFIRWTVASNMPCYYQETCLGPLTVWTPSECHSTLRYQPRNSRFPRKNLKHNLQLDWLRTTLASLHIEILSHIKSVHD